MATSTTSYLLQKAAPLIMKELGPRLEPLFTDRIMVPLARKVGPQVAQKVAFPLARKAGTAFVDKVGYPYVNSWLKKYNIDLPGLLGAEPKETAQSSETVQEVQTVAVPKKKGINLKDFIPSRKKKSKVKVIAPSPVQNSQNLIPSSTEAQDTLELPTIPPDSPTPYYFKNYSSLFGKKQPYYPSN